LQAEAAHIDLVTGHQAATALCDLVAVQAHGGVADALQHDRELAHLHDQVPGARVAAGEQHTAIAARTDEVLATFECDGAAFGGAPVRKRRHQQVLGIPVIEGS
jgi:hypothetical protein